MMTAFGMLAKLKGLRGTPFDPFGRTAERKAERALIAEYESTIAMMLAKLDASNLDAADRGRAAAGGHPRLRPRQGSQHGEGRGEARGLISAFKAPVKEICRGRARA